MRPTPSRATLTAVTAGIVLLMTAGPAAAHVSVDPDSAEAGSWAELTFRVPTERPYAATTRVEVVLPADQPLASVSVRPVPGWTVKTETRHLDRPLAHDEKKIDEAVSRVIWTGGKINPGEFQEFDVSLGPLPEHAGRMVFKMLQTYDNGEVVRWIDLPAADGADPEHPAPVLGLTTAAKEGGSADSGSSGSSGASDADGAATAKKPTGAESGEAGADVPARVLGGVGAAAGLAGLLAAATRRRATATFLGRRGW